MCDASNLHGEEPIAFIAHRQVVRPQKAKPRMGLTKNTSFHSNIPHTADNIFGIIYILFGLCSVLGNSTLLYISYKRRHLLKPAEYFIVNLALSDLAMTVTLYPLAITSSFSHRWLYGRHVCLFYAFCGVLFGICSLSTVTLLSTICCMKVCFPVYGNRFGHKQGCFLVACAWLYAAIFAFSPLLHWGEYGAEPYGTACCIDWYSSNKSRVAMSYTTTLFVLCFVIPCGIIITSYTLILVTVKDSRKAVEQHGVAGPSSMNNVQIIIVKLSIAVCIGFFTAWSPYAVIAMWAAFGSIDIIPPLVFAVPAVFAKSSTIYNPIIYLFLKPNFRNILAKYFPAAQEICTRSCLYMDSLNSCHYLPVIQLFHKLLNKRNTPASDSGKSMEEYPCYSCDQCKDTFEYFKNYPHHCHEMLGPTPHTKQDGSCLDSNEQAMRKNSAKKSIKVIVHGQKTSESDDLEITLEVIPVCSKCVY
ncbi:opsin-5-like [Xenopus tropicalis]|uniref:Opsin-5-like n=1 Tax=Xenopus tropicalis TaxID=8364 RepID=A0A8J1JRE8_XENTR|nr:opsin-5-like [Xenopus tropicalis]